MSSSKNPYRDGSNYFKLFDFILQTTKFTRTELVDFARNNLKMEDDAAEASVTVIMSPRAESTRGDCRGNMSSQGHLYYVEKLSRKVGKDGVKEEQEYKLQWRVKPMEIKTRKSVKAVKTVKAKKPKKAKTVKAKKPVKKAGVKKVKVKAKKSKKPAKKASQPAQTTQSVDVQPEAPKDGEPVLA